MQAYEAGDYAAAYRAWLPLAESGDVAAMRNVGHLYRWGQGVEKDIHQALAWYRRAAEIGFARAQANLAAIYLQGDDGVPVDYAEALKWFEAAAQQGHAVAQYNLGLMYELGLGTAANEAIALGWYNLAAKAGQQDALDRLSKLVLRRPPAGAALAQPSATPPAEDRPETQAAATPPAAQQPAPEPPPPAQPAPAEAASAAEQAPAVPHSEPPQEQPQARPQPLPEQADAADQERPAEGEQRSLLGLFYSAISSGGGVSLPDLFDSSDTGAGAEKSTPEQQSERRQP